MNSTTSCGLTTLGLVAALTFTGCSTDDDGPAPLAPQHGHVEALSYNVAGLPQGISGSNPEINIPQISPLLNAYELILAQEDFSYHELLAKDALHPYQSTPKEQHVKLVDDGLNRFSQFPWTSFERVQWVSCYGDANHGASDCLAEKGFSMARTDLGQGVWVDIYNHHAEAGNGEQDDTARAAGYQQLIAYIMQHSAQRPIILGGDTNLHADDPEDLPLLELLIEETGLTDACEQLNCGADHIDRFFFRSSASILIEPVAWRLADEFVDAAGEDLSDHPALNVRFVWQTR